MWGARGEGGVDGEVKGVVESLVFRLREEGINEVSVGRPLGPVVGSGDGGGAEGCVGGGEGCAFVDGFGCVTGAGYGEKPPTVGGTGPIFLGNVLVSAAGFIVEEESGRDSEVT